MYIYNLHKYTFIHSDDLRFSFIARLDAVRWTHLRSTYLHKYNFSLCFSLSPLACSPARLLMCLCAHVLDKNIKLLYCTGSSSSTSSSGSGTKSKHTTFYNLELNVWCWRANKILENGQSFLGVCARVCVGFYMSSLWCVIVYSYARVSRNYETPCKWWGQQLLWDKEQPTHRFVGSCSWRIHVHSETMPMGRHETVAHTHTHTFTFRFQPRSFFDLFSSVFIIYAAYLIVTWYYSHLSRQN